MPAQEVPDELCTFDAGESRSGDSLVQTASPARPVMTESIDRDDAKRNRPRIDLRSKFPVVGFHLRWCSAADRMCPPVQCMSHGFSSDVAMLPRAAHLAAPKRDQGIERTDHVERWDGTSRPRIGDPAVPRHGCNRGDPVRPLNCQSKGHCGPVRETGDIHPALIGTCAVERILDDARKERHIVGRGPSRSRGQPIVPALRIGQELRRPAQVRSQGFRQDECEPLTGRYCGPAGLLVHPLSCCPGAVKEDQERSTRQPGPGQQVFAVKTAIYRRDSFHAIVLHREGLMGARWTREACETLPPISNADRWKSGIMVRDPPDAVILRVNPFPQLGVG
jgi:hypothetical protein